MKKLISYIATGLLVLTATSCTDETLVNRQDGLRITGGIATESRTTFVDEGNLTHTHWVAEDAIGLYTTDQSNIPYAAVSSGKYSEFVADGSTSITAEENKKVRAYYPYSSKASGNLVPLPYTIGQTSNRPAAAFMYSEASISNNTLNFNFKHVYAYLKITISAQMYRENLPDGALLEGGGILIMATNPISVEDATFNMETRQITHNVQKEDTDVLFYYTEDLDYNGNDTYTYLIPILPQPANSPVTVYLFYPQEGDTGYVSLKAIIGKTSTSEGLLAGNVYTVDASGGTEQSQALNDFYQATGGSEWFNNTNWLSSKPLEEWYGLNDPEIGIGKVGYVYSMSLAANNLTGTLPASITNIMDNALQIDISQNALKGSIPTEIKEHRYWNKLGWLMVYQDPRKGGGFDLTDSKLYMPEEENQNLLDNTKIDLKDIFSKNKLTQVICYDASNVSDILTQFGASRVNQHLDYQSKGLGTVIFTCAENDEDNSTLVEGIKSKYGSVAGITWLYNAPTFPAYFGTSYVFDSNGQLVYIAPYTIAQENETIDTAYNKYLRETLGEPATHDEFSFEFYTSTDYSKDGEVFTIQNATAGNGVDLIFLGEGFVDTDMAAGGKYETKMKEAADKLFEIEPYKSLRKYFNLYGVKVVSPTAEFTDGAGKRINEEDAKGFELAKKYNTNLAKDARMMVVVIYNTDSYVDRSYCAMYEDGSFMAYNMSALDNTLIHEAGGHGIAKLADEYVEGGYETTTLPDDEKKQLDTFHATDWGWFSNVDYNSTKSTVLWSRLLNDSRYAKDNIGVIEGAYTYGKGVYRPSDNSMMRGNISWFNAPSREAIYKAVMTMSSSNWQYDYETFVDFDKNNIGSLTSGGRSAIQPLSKKEQQAVQEKHRKPIFIRGSWRNARSSSNSSITVPLR